MRRSWVAVATWQPLVAAIWQLIVLTHKCGTTRPHLQWLLKKEENKIFKWGFGGKPRTICASLLPTYTHMHVMPLT